MPLKLDVSEEVRAEIGDAEAERLIAGENAPALYDCTSCRNPGDTHHEHTSTVLFVGEETAVLAFAHAECAPSQVVTVSEEQLVGAVQNITVPGADQAVVTEETQGPLTSERPSGPDPDQGPGWGTRQTPGIGLAQGVGLRPGSGGAPEMRTGPGVDATPLMASGSTSAPGPTANPHTIPGAGPHNTGKRGTAKPYPPHPHMTPPEHRVPSPAVLGITCGLVLCQDIALPALVVEPTGPVTRPGRASGRDEFLPLLLEQGFFPVSEVEHPPAELPGWSVLVAGGKLHAVLQPSVNGRQNAWWQAHQPLSVTDSWRSAANRRGRVLVYAAPTGAIGRQPREDLLREALESAAARALLLGATLPLAGA